MKLTDIECRTAKPGFNPKNKDKEYTKPFKMADGAGLYLEVMNNGSKYWRLKYRINIADKTIEKRLALGVYPEVGLKEARNRRDEARRLIEEGRDPSFEKQKRKSLIEKDRGITFESVAREWYDNRKDRWRPRYATEVLTRLENDIFPHIGNYPISEIEPPLVLQVIRTIENRGAHELAKRQLQKCGEIFRYGIATGKAKADPTYKLAEALKPIKKTHFAALDVSELPEFLEAIEKNDARLYENTRNALKLIMLTFVRTSELINARWEEIDFKRKEWVIPAERMKMGKVHIVPLSKQSIEILQKQSEVVGDNPLVFPSSVKPRKSISNNTILGAIKRLGYQGRMTGHGFRALAMSAIKQELGYRHEVVDRQLAHTPKNKIDKAYDRAQFLEERTKMMQEWADYIDGLN